MKASELKSAGAGRPVYFAIDAAGGIGGQGEFLRQMAQALQLFPGSRVISRDNLPFTRFPYRFAYDFIYSTPVLRRMQDVLTLLSEMEFDKKLRDSVRDAALLDGVTDQCAETFQALKKSKTRLVLTCLNTHIDYLWETLQSERAKMGGGARHFLHPRYRERALREIAIADAIRVNSEWSKRTFVERGISPGKIHVIRPGIPHGHFYPSPRPEGDNIFRVLCVSSIDMRKGVYYLLNAFEAARIPNSELVLIGGTVDTWSKNMLAGFMKRNSNIRAGYCDVMSVPSAQTYGRASVFVHPALEDGYGLVIPQALASGLPVIATRESGASELIRDGENGFIIGRRSIDQIKDRLCQLASDSKLRDEMARKAPGSAAHLTYENFSREVARFYETMLTK